MDFQFDATADGRRLKFLNVIDRNSRICLAILVGRCCKAKDMVSVLEELTSLYSAPAFIRCDNSPESSPRLYGADVRPALPTARPTLRRETNGRTDSWNPSTAATGMSSSTPSYSPQLRRRRSWPIVGTGSPSQSGRTRPSMG